MVEEIDDPSISLFVAWVESTPRAYGFVAWSGPRPDHLREQFRHIPEIYRLTVEPDFQSRGIGTALIAAMESEARARGCSHFGLGVAYENPRAHQLYLRLGYSEIVAEYYDRYTLYDADGQRHDFADKCRFMSRSLG